MTARKVSGTRFAVLVAMSIVWLVGALAPHPAGAVIVCQKKKTFFLRPGPACKGKKEKVVADLTTFAQTSAVDTAVNAVNGKVGVVENELGLQCLKAATKGFVATSLVGVPAVRVSGCRTLDGKASECGNAFQGGSDGPESCFFYAGHCLACDDYNQGTRACTNACYPPECPAAPARTFAGDYYYSACAFLKTQAECDAGFESNRVYSTSRVAQSCFWVTPGDFCRSCDESQEGASKCTNACGSPVVTCAARSGPAKGCSAVGQQDCESRWLLSGDIPYSCYWDATQGFCTECSQSDEFLAKACHNAC